MRRTIQPRSFEIGPDFDPAKDQLLAEAMGRNKVEHDLLRAENPTRLDRANDIIDEGVAATADWMARNALVIAEAAPVAALVVSSIAITAPKAPDAIDAAPADITTTLPAGGVHELSVEYSEPAQAIVKANPNIANDKVGDPILIPKASTAPVAPATSNATTAPEAVTTTTSVPANSATTTVTPSQNIYLVGDSLLLGMSQNGMGTALASKGWDVTKDEASVGQTVTGAIPEILADAAEVKDSSTALVELDTNDCEIAETVQCEPLAEVSSQIQETTNTFRSINPNITIDWVTPYSDKENGDIYNGIDATITADAGIDKYNVINWAGYAASHTYQFSFDPAQGIHQTTYAGYTNEANVVVEGIGAAPAPVVAPTTTTAPQPKAEATPAPKASTTTESPEKAQTTTTEAPATTTTIAPPAPTTTTTAPAPAAAPAPEALVAPPANAPLDATINYELELDGYSPAGSAGVLGNFKAESGIQPERLENTASGVVTPYGNIPLNEVYSTNVGWGIAQWTNSIAGKIGNFAAVRHLDPNSQVTQVMYFENQVQSMPALFAALKNPANSPEVDAELVEADYERPATLSDAPTREAFAREEFNELNPPAPAPAPAPAPVATTTTTAPPATTTTTQAPQPSAPKHAVTTETTLPASNSVPKHAAPMHTTTGTIPTPQK